MRSKARQLANSRIGQRSKLPIKRGLASLGFELVSTHKGARAHLAAAFDRFDIAATLDVGANRGQFGALIRSLGYSGQILSVEPLGEAYTALSRTAASDGAWTTVQCAVGQFESTETLHISKNSTSSSLLRVSDLHLETEPTTKTIGEERVRVRSLDAIVAEAGVKGPYFTKIDVQGAEIGVLNGAAETLEQTNLMLIELSLRSLYEDSSDFIQVLSLLKANRFTPIGLEPAFEDPSSGDVLQIDLLAARLVES